MKECCQQKTKILISAAGYIGVLFIMAGLIWLMYHYTAPPPPDTARWNERKRNLNELTAQNKELLDSYGWVNKDKGLVRMPVSRALELAVKEGADPAAARALRLARVELATPPAPPPAATNAPTAAPAAPEKK